MTAPDAEFLRYAMLNGAVLSTEALQVSPLGPGFMFGEGVFETVRVHDSRLLLLEAHHARLAGSMRYLAAPPISTCRELHERCSEVIAANSLASGSVKIVSFREVSGWSELILARAPSYTAARYESGFRLKTVASDQRIDPLHALKSLNYLPSIHAKRVALAAGFDEAVFFDPQNHVLEGATTNVFIVKNRLVMTPPLRSGILPGIMRGCIMQMPSPPLICECDVVLDELLRADEVFVTNTLLGIMPVARVNENAYDLVGNSITRSLMGRLVESTRCGLFPGKPCE